MGSSLIKEMQAKYHSKMITHEIFGDITLYTPKDTNETKTYFSLKNVGYKFRMHDQNLIKNYKREESLSCGSDEGLCIWEYPGANTLAYEIKNQNSQHFNESYIWVILTQVVSCMYRLNKGNLYHGDLRAETIFIIDENRVKLADCDMLNLKNIMQRYQTEQNIQLTPQQKQNLEDFTEFDWPKSDVYTFGLTLCQMMTLTRLQDPQLLGFNVGSVYSRCLINLVNIMTAHEESNRPTFQNIFDALSPFQSDIRRNVPFYQHHDLQLNDGKIKLEKKQNFSMGFHQNLPQQFIQHSPQRSVVPNLGASFRSNTHNIQPSLPPQQIIHQQTSQQSIPMFGSQIDRPSSLIHSINPQISGSQAALQAPITHSNYQRKQSIGIQENRTSTQPQIRTRLQSQEPLNEYQNQMMLQSMSNLPKHTITNPSTQNQQLIQVLQQSQRAIEQAKPQQISNYSDYFGQNLGFHPVTAAPSLKSDNEVYMNYQRPTRTRFSSNTNSQVVNKPQFSINVKQTQETERMSNENGTAIKAKHFVQIENQQTVKKVVQQSYFPSQETTNEQSRDRSSSTNQIPQVLFRQTLPQVTEIKTQRSSSLHKQEPRQSQVSNNTMKSLDDRISHAIKLTQDLIDNRQSEL